MRNRRTRGHIADISKNTSTNAPTPNLFTAIVRAMNIRGGETECSFVWARVPTYASNCLTSVDFPVQGGTPIYGIILPAFGSYTDAIFATCEAGKLAGWGNEGLGPAVFTSDADLAPWSWAPLPSLGAPGFSSKKTAPGITGVRIQHPLLDAHEYKVKMAQNFRERDPLSLSILIS